MKNLLVILFVTFSTAVIAQINMDAKAATVDFVFLKDNTFGTVMDVNVSLSLNLNDLASSSVSGKAQVSSLSTGNAMRDKHLKSKNYFETEVYPTMSFESSSIVKKGDKYFAKGMLTIKDVTKEVSFEVSITDEAVVFNGTIFALDYGVSPVNKRENSKVKVSVSISTN
ncbi:MAG: YceI family protein [Crocinitomicaceae bacterium]|nr:YceI family protein [Crocinitomicaceae bacterium]